jgi:hypothetical protein
VHQSVQRRQAQGVDVLAVSAEPHPGMDVMIKKKSTKKLAEFNQNTARFCKILTICNIGFQENANFFAETSGHFISMTLGFNAIVSPVFFQLILTAKIGGESIHYSILLDKSKII